MFNETVEQWQYNWLDPSAAVEAAYAGWEPMTEDQKAAWLESRRHLYTELDLNHMDQYYPPTHRRLISQTRSESE